MSIVFNDDQDTIEDTGVHFETEDFYVQTAEIPLDPTKEDSTSALGYEVIYRVDQQVQGRTTNIASAIQAAHQAQQLIDSVRAIIDQQNAVVEGQAEEGLGSFLDLDLDSEVQH